PPSSRRRPDGSRPSRSRRRCATCWSSGALAERSMELTGSAVLVTGANGFVGTHLTRALAAAGARVHGAGLGTPHPDLPFAAWHPCDVLDAEAVRTVVASVRPAAIVHLAGQASAALSFQQPVET